MTKVKLTISIDKEIADGLRTRSIAKYGNARSFSLLIEDLAPLRFSRDEPSEEELEAILAEFVPRCTKEGGCTPVEHEYYKCENCGAVFETLHNRIFPPRCCPYCSSDDICDSYVIEFSNQMGAEQAARRRWKSGKL